MFIVRVDFKNGLHLEFNFAHVETGEQCRSVCAAAAKKGDRASIFDEAGRQCDLDGSQVQAVQLVNLQEETVSIIRVGFVVDDIRQRLMPSARPQMAQQTAEDPSPLGAIARSVFAS